MQTEKLSFAYPRRPRVLRDVSVSFDGTATCILGPNGAGKSTLMRLATGQLRPAAGRITHGDLTLSSSTRREWARHVGWMPQDIPVAPGMTVSDQVAYVGWLHGLSAKDARTFTAASIEKVGLGSLADRRVSELSGGQRRRVGLASGIVHRPPYVFLDEPTAGLDPRQRDRFAAVLQSVAEHSRVVVSTHQTEHLHKTYDRIVVLEHGKLAFSGTTEEFIALSILPSHAEQASHINSAYAVLVGEGDL